MAESSERKRTRYILAAVFANPILFFVIWYVINNLLSYAIEGRVYGDMEPMAGWFWCCIGFFAMFVVLMPLAYAGEIVLVQRQRLPWFIHLPVIAIAFGIANPVSVLVLLQVVNGNGLDWERLYTFLFSFVDFAVWGGAFWAMLRVTDHVLRR